MTALLDAPARLATGTELNRLRSSRSPARPEAMEVRGDRVYIAEFDHNNHNGHLLVVDQSGNLLKDVAMVDGDRVHAGGLSIYGNYAYVPLTGDGTIVARVATVSSEATWVKAGVMIRGSLSPSSAQAFMLASSAKGTAFQRRLADANASISTSGSASTTPRWVKLTRTGSTITAFESADGVAWTAVGSNTFVTGASVEIGLAVSSHVNGALATATFDNVSVTRATAPPPPPPPNVPPTVALTSPLNGATATAPATITVTAQANDSDGTIARVDFYAGATKLGTATTAPYAFTWTGVAASTYTLTAVATDNAAAVTTSSAVTITVTDPPTVPPGPGLPTGWQQADVGATGAAGTSTFTNGVFTVTGGGADVWGTADAFQYVYRTLDGDGSIVARVTSVQNVANWTKAGVMMRSSLSPASAQGYMLVSSAKGLAFQRRLADGNVSVSTSGAAAAAPRWVKLTRTGNTIAAFESADGSVWTQLASSTFVMGSSIDVGLAVSSHVSGVLASAAFDNIVVSSNSVVPPPPPPPPNVVPTVSLTSPADGATMQAPATVTVTATASDNDGTIARIEFFAGTTRLGISTTAPYSVTWNNVTPGTYSLTAVAVDNAGGTTQSPAVSVTVTAPPPPPSTALLPGWSDADVGAVPFAGNATLTNGTYTVTGSGADVWGTADQFNYAYRAWTGDGTLIARIASEQNVSSWVKAGVMIRATPAADSAHAFMLVSPAKGTAFQRRGVAGGASVSTAGPVATAPRWVKLTRIGDNVTAYDSADGLTWTLVGSDTIPMGASVLVGLAVTSHNSGALATATFDNVSIR